MARSCSDQADRSRDLAELLPETQGFLLGCAQKKAGWAERPNPLLCHREDRILQPWRSWLPVPKDFPIDCSNGAPSPPQFDPVGVLRGSVFWLPAWPET